MAARSTTSPVKHSDTDQILADPAEDIRGRDVPDPDGERLGKVDDLLIDTDEHKVRLLGIEHGDVGAPRYDPDVIDASELFDSLYAYSGHTRP